MLTPVSGPAYATEHDSLLDVRFLRTQLANMRQPQRLPQSGLYPVPSGRSDGDPCGLMM
ncbi:hypothetical protein GT037_011254 [Alternaria burnsii]|uniref:Uncharacterized protein n=1 Tax=Alternaria burnsii TaxID=1187904 RepID=A0A8H7AW01_9PLEO|nr:uncharacterized protein GT037_011254 [Alternaria burnsii]KAF7670675.1 hypothetical protein GT037_011254 [Alternaria burnsii]